MNGKPEWGQLFLLCARDLRMNRRSMHQSAERIQKYNKEDRRPNGYFPLTRQPPATGVINPCENHPPDGWKCFSFT